jgi:hypothetical protein
MLERQVARLTNYPERRDRRWSTFAEGECNLIANWFEQILKHRTLVRPNENFGRHAGNKF